MHFETDVFGNNAQERTRAFFRTFIELGSGEVTVGPRDSLYSYIRSSHAAVKHVKFGCLG